MALAMRLLQELLTKLFFLRFILGLLPLRAGRDFLRRKGRASVEPAGCSEPTDEFNNLA